MKRTIMIIESKGKIPILKEFFPDFEIYATGGAFQKLEGYLQKDLSKHTYLIKEEKKTTIKRILEAVENADEIILATDADREGEVIAKNLFDLFPKYVQYKVKNIKFNEITKEAIDTAIENPVPFDINKINAQKIRAAIDQEIGSKLTRILRKYFPDKNISGGRVTSLILKMVAEHTIEMEQNKEYETKKIKYKYSFNPSPNPSFLHENDNLLIYPKIPTQIIEVKPEQLHLISNGNHKNIPFKITRIKKELKQNIPLNTADLLLSFTEKNKNISLTSLSKILQELYEEGLITYPRTDSRRISSKWTKENIKILSKLTLDAITEEKIQSWDGITEEHTQGAHEALRPTKLYEQKEFEELKKTIKNPLKAEVFEKIYNSIITLPSPKIKIVYELSSKVIDRTLKMEEKAFNPSKNINDFIDVDISLERQSSFLPMTINSILKELINDNVGRPSTYATLIEGGNFEKGNLILKPNGEVFLTKGKGDSVANFIRVNFKKIINKNFTKELEEKLELVESGEVPATTVYNLLFKNINDFIKTFEEEQKGSGLDEEELSIIENIGINTHLNKNNEEASFEDFSDFQDFEDFQDFQVFEEFEEFEEFENTQEIENEIQNQNNEEEKVNETTKKYNKNKKNAFSF
ncbi:MAG: DNA topoisomerase [Mycoplasma sp.]